MRLHCHEAFEVVRHWGRFDAQHVFGCCFAQARQGRAGRFQLSQKQRAIEHEVVVVLSVAGVDVERPFAVVIFPVGVHRFLVPENDVVVVAAEHVDVRGHMHEMACVRDKGAQDVSLPKGRLGRRGHLHQVDVEVQQTGVRHGVGAAGKGVFKRAFGLHRGGTAGGLAGFQIPHLPWG